MLGTFVKMFNEAKKNFFFVLLVLLSFPENRTVLLIARQLP